MFNKFIKIILGVSLIISITGLYSDGEVVKEFKVKGGKVKVGKVKYHVYKGVKKVEGAFGGISFTIKTKSSKDSKKIAKRVMKFYQGKKIKKIKLPKFTKSGKPETNGWVSSKCTKKSGGAEAVVKISGKLIHVFLVPSCQDLEAFVM